MTKKLTINLSTGQQTTDDLTSDEVTEREAIATENAKTKYIPLKNWTLQT